MTWKEWLAAGIGLVYAAMFIGYVVEGRTGFAMMFAGYAIAQVGIILAALGR